MTGPVSQSDHSAIAYAQTIADFRIGDLAGGLARRLDAGTNACAECCEAHAASGLIALVW
jgi:hypothetical protein